MKRLMAIILALSLLALCGCGAPAEPPAEAPTEVSTEAPTEAPTEREIPTAPAEKNYTVTVIDEFDGPVAGVSVEVNGTVSVTDQTGVVTFALEVGEYAVKIVEVPFGYALRDTQTEFKFEEDVTYLTVYMSIDDGEFDEASLDDDAPVEDLPADDMAPEG